MGFVMDRKFSAVGKCLSAEGTAVGLGFANGFLWKNEDCDVKEMAEYPLTTALEGAIGGILASMGTVVVHSLMPPRFKWIPSVLLIGSLGVIAGKRIRKLHRRRRKCKVAG
ncbi:MAG: hypothetical protein Hyperionvirus2_137 [Hyperionvirus sp.]|uniref:Uncharacterized protein n=1 Tax=Hyperionvirus sp. TaxID=2487770 RepID=A0A3G5ABU7_9VIRU|nr:MAG: hypothetical protein Hyperionvirus2_137 [Hyperionvirus sp.]